MTADWESTDKGKLWTDGNETRKFLFIGSNTNSNTNTVIVSLSIIWFFFSISYAKYPVQLTAVHCTHGRQCPFNLPQVQSITASVIFFRL